MCRLFLATLPKRREPLRNHAKPTPEVPIPPTPCQMERVRKAVRKDYEEKPALGRKVENEITLNVFGATGDDWALTAVAKRYCQQYLNGF